MLDALQRTAFDYFLKQSRAHNGLVADTSRAGSPVSIAVVGFGLSVYPVAVERDWMARDVAVRRCLTTLRFFAASDQGGTADSTGHQGFYFHFLDAEILTGIGRMPAVLGLNLEAAGVACDDVAGVHVDDFLRTSNSRIFAAGDVCLAHQYTNTAQASARIVVRSALLFGRRRMSALTTPW